jgi:hypothetical protein
MQLLYTEYNSQVQDAPKQVGLKTMVQTAELQNSKDTYTFIHLRI